MSLKCNETEIVSRKPIPNRTEKCVNGVASTVREAGASAFIGFSPLGTFGTDIEGY